MCALVTMATKTHRGITFNINFDFTVHTDQLIT
jgi:hypothetical protein